MNNSSLKGKAWNWSKSVAKLSGKLTTNDVDSMHNFTLVSILIISVFIRVILCSYSYNFCIYFYNFVIYFYSFLICSCSLCGINTMIATGG